ncbi:MAG: bh protein [Actinobacteria bacterium]|nr:bh protein [Actinomycetota bacterium]
MTKKTKTILHCIECGEETTHTINYLGDHIRGIQCDKCNSKVELDRRELMTVFTEDFIDRVLTKPKRLTVELVKVIAPLIPFLPKRLMKEPRKVLKDVFRAVKGENEKEATEKK